MFKRSILLLSPLFVFGLIACSGPSQQSRVFTPGTRISANLRIFDPSKLASSDDKKTPPEVAEFFNSQSLSRAQVLRTVESLKAAFKSSYIGYRLKKELIGKSGDEIFTACKNRVGTKTSYSVSEYYDFIRSCLANFKDGHISLNRLNSQVGITSPIAGAAIVDQKIIITNIRPALIKKLEELAGVAENEFLNKIKPGYEIVSIDGKSAMSETSSLVAYISNSSAAGALNRAVDVYFSRNIAYPKKSEFEVVLRDEHGNLENLTLPWIQFSSGAPLSRLELDQIGIPRIGKFSEETAKILKPDDDNYNYDVPFFKELNNKMVFEDSDESAFAITGFAKLAGQNVCYLKLNSFSIESNDNDEYEVFRVVGQSRLKTNLIDALRSFLVTCDNFQAPLVLDLRQNGGGNAYFAQEFFSLFETQDKPTIYAAYSRLIEIGNTSVINGLLRKIDQPSPPLWVRTEFDLYKKAAAEKASYSDWLITGYLKMSRSVFAGKVLALISSDCVSACESTANHFKTAKRGVLVGTPTQGTGFGFSSINMAETKYRDPYNSFEVSIPNHAFNVFVPSPDFKFESDDDMIVGRLPFSQLKPMENSPVTPNVHYQLVKEDYFNNYSGFKKLLETLL